MNLIDQLAGALFPGVSSGGSMGATSMLPEKPMGFLSMIPGGPGGAMSLLQPAALGGPAPNAAPAAPRAPEPQPANQPPALANALGAILKESGAVPPPKLAPPALTGPSASPALAASPAQASMPRPQAVPNNGISGQDVAMAIKAALMGAAGVNPGSPMGSAFFQGAGGAVAAQDKFSRDAAASKLAAEDRALKLEDRDLKLDDRAWNRSKDMTAQKRNKRNDDLKMLEITSKVMKNIDPSLDVKDRIAIERLVRDEGKRLRDEDSLRGEELKTEMETYRKGLEERVKGGGTGGVLGVPAPAAPGTPSGAVKPAPGGTVYGATPESPATGGSGADKSQPAMPRNKTDFDNLPSGAYFINPSDGRVLLKK